jgi:eukaryotic-like serine/threonine-protein kinase
MCVQRGDIQLTALCEALLARCETYEGHADRAEARSCRAKALAAEGLSPWKRSRVLLLSANCIRSYAQARPQYQEALALLESVGDRIWPAQVKSNLGYSATLAGDFGQARRSLEEAAADAETVWGAGLKAMIRSNLGLLDLFEGQDAKAREGLSGALAVLRRIGDQPGAREALTGLAALAVKQNRRDHASRLAAAAEVLYAGPLSWAEELMHARWLRELPTTAHGGHVANELAIGSRLDAILAEASGEPVASR